MGSKAEFVWSIGIALEPLLKAIEKFCAENELGLTPTIGGTVEKPYVIGWLGRSSLESARCPWELHPLTSPIFQRLDWTLNRGEQEWFRCCIFVDKDPPPLNRTCVRDGKVIRFVMCFDEEPNAWWMKMEETSRAVQKYRQIYELFKLLDCDEVNGYSDSHYSAGTEFCDDPEHLQKIFRFARTGRQILVAPMEEGRARRDGENNWRIVVEPSKTAK